MKLTVIKDKKEAEVNRNTIKDGLDGGRRMCGMVVIKGRNGGENEIQGVSEPAQNYCPETLY
jgi:hypothetical protein